MKQIRYLPIHIVLASVSFIILSSLGLNTLHLYFWGETDNVDALITEVSVVHNKKSDIYYYPSLTYQYQGKTYSITAAQTYRMEIYEKQDIYRAGDTMRIEILKKEPRRILKSTLHNTPIGLPIFYLLIVAVFAFLIHNKFQIDKQLFNPPPFILVLSVVLIAIGTVYLVSANQSRSERLERAEQCTEETQAVVYESQTKNTLKDILFNPKVSYQHNGQNYQTEVPGSCLYPCIKNDIVTIRINPNQPESAIMANDFPYEFYDLWLGILFIIHALGLMAVCPRYSDEMPKIKLEDI